ncbi:helix-turn-helix domain-containing protein [Nonomuraea basaltis]|uniref:helix-turn-helix domain-containing protein n=1 Tax=Nonomuraea basaltis TaxID=2495887 RepID=UPI00110C44A5|nr:helix-turn-helix transcriptional regulator [Nonomuraea basaltis]TMR92693.1 helix-turn-helix transcriptional regulator [Nonomuraea basaltis]
MGDRHELAGFLRSRRDRLTPESVGLAGGERRRVAGLRREEVALLAGISVEYYQRLEQGRVGHPSPEVLDAIATALRLDDVERDHLRALARAARERHRAPIPRAETVRPELARMLHLVATPAMVLNDRFDVLAANAVAVRLFALDVAPGVVAPNLARHLFLAPAARDFYVDWDAVAAVTAGQLRVTRGRYPADGAVTELIRELGDGSGTFRALWSAGDVDVRAHGAKSLRHPALGTVTFAFEHFAPVGEARQRLVVLVPEADSATEAAVQLLATWAHAQPAALSLGMAWTSGSASVSEGVRPAGG